MARVKNRDDEFLDLLSKPWSEAKRYTILPDTHPEFAKGVEAVARQAGIPTPHVMVIPSPIPNALTNVYHGGVFMSQGYLDVAGQSLQRAPNHKVRMVLAHEMSHLRDGMKPFATAASLRRAMPLVGLAAVYLYDKSTKLGEATAETLQTAHDGQVSSLREGYAALPMSPDPEENAARARGQAFQEQMWTAGKYLAGAAAGYGVGLGMTRKIILAAEYRADRAAMRVGRDPEGFVQHLDDMVGDARKIMRARWQKAPPAATFAERVSDFLGEARDALREVTEGAHPSHPDRLAAARSYMRRIEDAEARGTALPR